MELTKIKNLNQKIYLLDTEITRNAKMMFIATLIFVSKNNDFWDVSKLTTLVNFNTSDNPVDDLILLAKKEVDKLPLLEKTKNSVYTSLSIISGVNTKLNNDRVKLQEFVKDFIINYLPELKNDESLFLETLYMEVDKKAKGANEGITLTPDFAARLMVDLVELDYKKDVVADLSSGTGLFSLLSYSLMINDLNKDRRDKVITEEEFRKYSKRLADSVVANDWDERMVTLTLANFIIKGLNTNLLYNENVFEITTSMLNVGLSKGILNPPYEDQYKPLEMILQNIKLIKSNKSINNKKLVVIIPPQKFGQKRAIFKQILDYSTLQSVIKMQDDLFTDSGQTPSTSIFVFDLEKNHKANDVIGYYDFTNSGYVYLKDSGMVDKDHTHFNLKKDLLERINNKETQSLHTNFVRSWDNFYEVNKELETKATINPNIIASDKEEADITLENITIKKMLEEKKTLINQANNSYLDKDKKLEKYIIDILSEEI